MLASLSQQPNWALWAKNSQYFGYFIWATYHDGNTSGSNALRLFSYALNRLKLQDLSHWRYLYGQCSEPPKHKDVIFECKAILFHQNQITLLRHTSAVEIVLFYRADLYSDRISNMRGNSLTGVTNPLLPNDIVRRQSSTMVTRLPYQCKQETKSQWGSRILIDWSRVS